MIRFLSFMAAASLALAATGADAKACRDASGKFAACPAAAPAPAKPAAKGCRDSKGHFAKCGPEQSGPPAAARAGTPSAAPTTGGGLIGMARNAASRATPARPDAATPKSGTPTARCKDGTLSYSQHRSGTCSGHHGVATWM